MREIKFRVWHSANKEMMYDPSLLIEIYDGTLWLNCGEEINNGYDLLREQPESLNTIMQFTGLLDKNGTELYESDVVRSNVGGEIISKIVYMGRGFVMQESEEDEEMDCVWYYDFEIIGNIYENPELLNE